MILHLVHIVHLIQIWQNGTPDAVKRLNPQKVPYLVVVFYTVSIIYWVFASASPINDNTVDDLVVFERYGSSLVFYLSAVLLNLLLASWFKKVFTKNIHGSLVNDLLNAELRYTQGLKSFHEEP